MARDNIQLTDIGRHGVTSFTSDSVNESTMADMVAFDTQIYQGAIGYGQQVSTGSQGDHPQLDAKREEHNLLYAQTATSTAIRHPTVRTLSGDRPVLCSLDSLDEIPSSRNWHNRCLTILLVIAGVIAVLSVIAAVLAYITVLGDECTCDNVANSPLPVNGTGNTSNETLRLLEQDAAQINMSSNNLSLIFNDLMVDLTNLNESANTLRGPVGETGPRGDNGTMGPQGDPGPQGYSGTPGFDGSDGSMGVNGSNAMLTFSNVDLFQNNSICRYARGTMLLTSSNSLGNIPIHSLFENENPVILERACVITPTANATSSILPAFDGELCTCRTNLNGGDTAECILIQLECIPSQITFTQT